LNNKLCAVLNFVFREYNLKPIIAERFGEHGALYCAEEYGETQLCTVLNFVFREYNLKPITSEQYGEHEALYCAELWFRRLQL